jgi:hypothetical protein
MTTFNDCCFSLPLRNFDLFICLLAPANQTRIKGEKLAGLGQWAHGVVESEACGVDCLANVMRGLAVAVAKRFCSTPGVQLKTGSTLANLASLKYKPPSTFNVYCSLPFFLTENIIEKECTAACTTGVCDHGYK